MDVNGRKQNIYILYLSYNTRDVFLLSFLFLFPCLDFLFKYMYSLTQRKACFLYFMNE